MNSVALITVLSNRFVPFYMLFVYLRQVEYSKRYEQTIPPSQNCVHLLSEAHLLLRASLLCPTADTAKIQEAFNESCAQLGDYYSR